MSRKAIIAIVMVAVLVAGVVSYRLWFSDERAIKKQLALVEKEGSKAEGEQPMDGLIKAVKIAALFSDPCQLIVESVRYDGSYSRKDIQEYIMLVRSLFTRVEVSMHDVVIDRIVNKTTVVRGTLRLHGKATGEAVADAYKFQAEAAKIDGEWLFTSVTIVELLE